MPGFCGGIGCSQQRYEGLKKWFMTTWDKCDIFSTPKVFLCGHAHADASSLCFTDKGLHFVVDGEGSIYRNVSRFVHNGEPALFRFKDNKFSPTVHCKGNIAIYDENRNVLYLLTEWTGSFPLYYAQTDGGLLFSSHLKPLSEAIGAIPDPVGIIEFMRYGYILAGRTHFKGIRRLLPGQCIVYQKIHNYFNIYETSQAWTKLLDEAKVEEIAEHIWHLLGNAIQRCFEFGQQHALMVSSGWDSRLLLAGMRENIGRSEILSYTHGDTQSRALSLTAQICQESDIKHHLEPLDNSLYDLQVLQRGFDRVGLFLFPHWCRAGVRLLEDGAKSVSAGIFGEVIGGHNCRTMLLGDWGKMLFVASCLLGMRRNQASKNKQDLSGVYNFLRLDHLNKPWYVREDYWRNIPEIKEQVNADIKESLHRLEVRGVKDADALIEAYITEFLGCQNWGAQLLSCRAYLNINNVFGDQQLYNFASKVPLSIKINNSLNQAILRRYAPDLLHYPTAAILISIGAPVVVQEVTRILRKKVNNLSWKINLLTQGYFRPKFLGWDNFEFLRDGKTIKNLLDNIKNDLVDKNAIEKFIDSLVRRKRHSPLYSVSNQLMKIYTTDLMLR